MALKKSQLYSSLWSSCDELRGGMDASQYKDYVLTLLFMKYVSDKYAGKPDALIEVPAGGSFDDMVILKGDKEIGDKINKIISRFAEANDLQGVIDQADFNDENKLGAGKEMQDRLSKLVAIFGGLDFRTNRAEGDDLLGDAYEYLMRNFATESGKSKGQFYTPAEVSRVMAQVVGIGPDTTQDQSIYDPTCGSGSLLLKAAEQAPRGLTVYGQEMDVATWALAKMNMILHGYITAEIQRGNTLASPQFSESNGIKRFDFAVANPPFSAKAWSSGLDPLNDEYDRFHYGVPPTKNGDFAFLQHLIASLKSTGKGAIILPHGVLFRGNKEADIRRQLIQHGLIKGIIGLPPNLFYGTGIPACIVVIDKEHAAERTSILMIDASRGYLKDGNKNRLREQDIHKIVDVFNRQAELPRYSRMVPVTEIADPANDYNLNIPRYIDASEPEDLQDLDAHLNGGIPNRDIDALKAYWVVFPSLRETLFKDNGRPGYSEARVAAHDVREAIVSHPEFKAFEQRVSAVVDGWLETHELALRNIDVGNPPKTLIHTLAEDLLQQFVDVPLINHYDMYQRLMDYWVETMQDDAYAIAAEGWVKGAQPREIVQVKDKNNKLIWPEAHDFVRGKRRFKSDLIPAPTLVARYFKTERDALERLDNQLTALDQQLEQMREENSGEEGLLAEVTEGDGEKQKVAAKDVKARLKEIGFDADYADERAALEAYEDLLEQQRDTRAKLKTAQRDLDKKIDAKYPKLSEPEIKGLVVEDKWADHLSSAVQAELDLLSQSLTGRIRELTERYDTPLPELVEEISSLSERVNQHFSKMGVSWR